jgi:hypothetical protein
MGEECRLSDNTAVVDSFFFAATGDQGAVGDVVGVEISLQVNVLRSGLKAFEMVGCFDAEKMDLLETQAYSDFFEELVYISHFFHLGETDVGPQRTPSGEGFHLSGNFRTGATDLYLGAQQSVPILTVFFRLKGQPGDVATVRFCDSEFVYQTVGRSCVINSLYHQGPELVAMSTLHKNAEIRILAGPATRPDPPAVPPDARVYEDIPHRDEVAARFELTGAVTRPGERSVPLDLYITSEREFSGFVTSIVFGSGVGGDPQNRYFDIVQVDEWTRPGAVSVRPDLQGVGIAMANSRRRIGSEGERVKIATIYLDIADSAESGSEIKARFAGNFGFQNSVMIQALDGIHVLPAETRVEPLYIEEGLVKVVGSPIRLGDVNADGALDLTDPVAILNHLFLGRRDVLCAGAADCNLDSEVDMADPITLLMYLFAGSALDATSEVDCR